MEVIQVSLRPSWTWKSGQGAVDLSEQRTASSFVRAKFGKTWGYSGFHEAFTTAKALRNGIIKRKKRYFQQHCITLEQEPWGQA